MLIDTRLVPGPLLFSSIALTVLTAHRERRSIDFHGLKWALSGRVVGTMVGISTLLIVSRNRIAMVLGVVVLLAVAMSASGLHLRPVRWTLFTAGALSGFTGTTVAIGGPPIALVYQNEPGSRLRGTLAGFFVVGASLSIVMLALVGRFGIPELLSAVALVPGILVGFLVSGHGARLLDRGYTRAGVLVVSAAAGLAVILKQLL
jgi:uncharacterized membrane protein YfcA